MVMIGYNKLALRFLREEFVFRETWGNPKIPGVNTRYKNQILNILYNNFISTSKPKNIYFSCQIK